MTKLLERALEKIASLPEEEQDRIAAQVLAELEDEAAWTKQFAGEAASCAGLPRKRYRSIAKERLTRWMILFDRIPRHETVP
jgi:uncharacterized protein (DUF2336 family)